MHWVPLFLSCFSPQKKNFSRKTVKAAVQLWLELFCDWLGVLFIKTCFCRKRKSVNQQKSIVSTGSEVENNETSWKQMKGKIERLVGRNMSSWWPCHRPFILLCPNILPEDSIDAFSLLWDMILIETQQQMYLCCFPDTAAINDNNMTEKNVWMNALMWKFQTN